MYLVGRGGAGKGMHVCLVGRSGRRERMHVYIGDEGEGMHVYIQIGRVYVE